MSVPLRTETDLLRTVARGTYAFDQVAHPARARLASGPNKHLERKEQSMTTVHKRSSVAGRAARRGPRDGPLQPHPDAFLPSGGRR